MSLTSLGIASHGLLDGGSKPMLHLATGGLIRLGGSVQLPPMSGPHGRGHQESDLDALIKEEDMIMMAVIEKFLELVNG